MERVKKIFSFIHREYNGLHEAAFLLAFSSFLSQLLALLRDRLLAFSFGAGGELDVYYAAFRIPDLVYVSIASFVSITVLIPFLVDRIEQGEMERARQFMSAVFTVFCLVMVVVSVVLFFAMPALASLAVPGFSEAARAKMVLLSRIMLFSPLLLGISNLLGSATQTFKNFFVYALSPILYNVGIIAGVVVFYPYFGIAGLAWGVALGALLHLAIQLPNLWSKGFLPRFTARFNWRELREVVAVSLPRTLTLSVHQLALLVLVSIASLDAKGSIAVFNFAFNLQSVPLAIVGVSYSVAAFPMLARLFSRGEKQEFHNKISTAIRHIIFWSMPATVMFVVLRAQIVRSILGAGKFDWSNTRLTAACLAIFSISVIAQSLVLLFARAYYAAGRTKIPLILNTASSLLIIVLAYVLNYAFVAFASFRLFVENLLRVEGLAGTGVFMLPLAFSLGLVINVIAYWVVFERDFERFPRRIAKSFAQMLLASVFGGFIAYETLVIVGSYVNIDTFIGIFSQGLVAGLVGLLATYALLLILNNNELKELAASMKKKFWKVETVVAPEPEEL